MGPARGAASASAAWRMDMHVHSRASSAPAHPALAAYGVPESCSPPERVYEHARARGMALVTLTDHDTIDGAFELVDRGFEGVVIGEEVTTRFAEDGCVLHVLVWGLSPAQHEQIGAFGLRDDVHDLAWWLRGEKLAHSVAHPLYAPGGRLTLAHLERCALLFRAMETLSGAHAGARSGALVRWLEALDAERLGRLAAKHGLRPVWDHAGRLARTGGSDDHALLNVGRTWTEAAPARSAHEFLERVMAGEGRPGGQEGSTTSLAHQMAGVLGQWAALRASPDDARMRGLVRSLGRFAGVETARPGGLERALGAFRRGREPALARALRESLAPALQNFPDLAALLNPRAWAREGAPLAHHERMAAFTEGCVRRVAERLGRDRRPLREALVPYGALLASAVPEAVSLFHQHKDARLVEEVEAAARGDGVDPGAPTDRPLRVALFTDTLGEVNGVSRFLRGLAAHARAAGWDLTIVTVARASKAAGANIKVFEPLATFPAPGCPQLELALPPAIEMLRWAERPRPDVVHVSTPGPVGVLGAVAARATGALLVATHHTDFPAYVERMLGSAQLAGWCAAGLRQLYARCDRVLARSSACAGMLGALGVDGARVRTLPPGVDVETFHPRHRDTSIWARVGARPTGLKALYVGRVSVEKNVAVLARVWRTASAELARLGVPAELVVVGDGPARGAMGRDLEGAPAVFAGVRRGPELSALYATADLLLFPSETDTLGQAALEAQASGVAAIVSDAGGPREIVDDGVTGLVAAAGDERAWVDAVVRLLTDDALRERLGRTAHLRAGRWSSGPMYEAFWRAHMEAAGRAAPIASDVRAVAPE